MWDKSLIGRWDPSSSVHIWSGIRGTTSLSNPFRPYTLGLLFLPLNNEPPTIPSKTIYLLLLIDARAGSFLFVGVG